MAGYSARQSTFTTGDTITAAHSNDEFNQILAAFHVSTGHTHDGTTAGDGGPLSTLYSNAISMGTGADTDIAITFNANSNDGVITWMEDEDYFQFSDDLLLSTTEKIQFRDTAIYINSSADGQLDLVADTEIQIAATTVDINGNVDISGSLTLGGTAITSTAAELNIMDGDTSATSTTVADADRVVYNDAGTMKQVAVTDLDTYISATSKTLTNKTLTSPVLNTGVSGTAVADEDDMSSNSATKLATQQSIKAYVDAQITAEDLDVTTDSGTIAIDLDSETLTIAGGTGLDSSATSNTVTLAIDSTVATLTGSQTLTNKTLTSPVLNTGVSGTAVLDEDNMASNSATQLATQQSIKAYVDAVSTGITTFVIEDDDGTEVTISDGKEVKFIGSGVTTNWTDTDNGTDGDPYDLTFTVDAAQTGITSILATDLKIGEDDQTKIDFETADEIHFYAANAEQVYVADGVFGPQTDSDVDLGTTGVRWKDAYVDSVTVTDDVTIGGDLTVNGTTTTVNSTTVTIDDPIFTLGGDSAPGSDDNKDRGIEFRWHNGTAAKVGFFGYDDSAGAFTFIPDATNSSEVFSGTAGNVTFGNIAGTLTTAAQTNITSVGALDGGSITSGFGAIDVGSSAITTTGTVTGGTLAGTLSTAAQTNITSLGTLSTLTVDNVIINGTTIGHTDDTDLMTLASGGLTVAGTIEGTTITASTALVPDTSGGADIGSTSLEWGDLYIADDKKIYLGSDQDVSIEYDEDGNDTTAVVAAGGISFAPHGTGTGNGTELRFQELAANGANYVGFKAPDSIASNEVWVLPNADGSANQVLKTDGSNALSWVDQAGGGEVSLVADGAISAQKPVILTSDGKAKQVAETGNDVTEGIGTANQFNSTNAINYPSTSLAQVADDKVAVAYRDAANSNYGVVQIATVDDSGRTISFGTKVVINSVAATGAGVAFDTSRSVLGATIQTDSDPKLIIANFTISGTTLTKQGSSLSLITTDEVKAHTTFFDPDNNHIMVFLVYVNSTDRTFRAVAVTGNSSGTPTSSYLVNVNVDSTYFDEANPFFATYDTNVNAFFITANKSEPSTFRGIVVTNSGTALTATERSKTKPTNYKNEPTICFDSNNNKVVMAYNTTGNYNEIVNITMTTNDFTLGTPTSTTSIGTGSSDSVSKGFLSFDPTAQRIVLLRGGGGSATSRWAVFSNDGTDFTEQSTGVWDSSTNNFAQRGGILQTAMTTNMDSNPIPIIMNNGDTGYGYAAVYTVGQTPVTNLDNGNYLGVAKAAISDTATGTIVMPGGISEGHSSLTIGNHYFTNGAGTIGLSGNARGEQYLGKAIAADKIQLLENEGYLYGTADGAITAGKPVQVKSDGDFQMIAETSTSYSFAQGSSLQLSVGTNVSGDIAYNTNTDKMCVAQIDSGTGKLVIHHGTVNGGTTNTVTWGSTDVRTSVGSGDSVRLSYDPVSYKTFCGFYNGSQAEGFIFTNSSGTSSTAGTSSNFYSSDPYGIDAVNVGEDKWVVLYRGGSDYPKCRVVSASGTTISYGTETTVNSSAASGTVAGHLAALSMSYDTANDKVVVFVKNTSGDLLGFVGTVSGTDISFGSASANLDGGGSNAQPSPKGQQYLPKQGVHICSYYQASDTSGSAIAVKVSGTSLVNADGDAPGLSSSMEFDSQTVLQVASVVAYESTYSVVYSDDSVDINLNTFGLSGTTLTKGTDRAIETTTATNTCAAAYDPDTKRVVVIFKENSNNDIYYQVVAIEGTETTTNMATDGESYLGIATKTVANDAQAEVATFGQIDAQQSSLTAGQKYFVQSDGSLATSADSVVPGYTGTVTTVAGKALSATKLLITE